MQQQHSREQHFIVLCRTLIQAVNQKNDGALVRLFSLVILPLVSCREAQDSID